MDPTPDSFAKVVQVIQAGGTAALAAVSLFINYVLWGALKEERASRIQESKSRLEDTNTAAEKMLKMAEQNSEIAKAINATTITNTAALEANRATVEKSIRIGEKVLAAIDRFGGK